MEKARRASKSKPPRSRLIPGCALFLLISCVMGLSSERLIFTTSYPSPAGIYQTMTVTGQTVLARDGGRVEIGPQAAPNEGGELFLRGGGANPAAFIDNFSGRFRIVTTQPGAAERFSLLQNGRVGIGWAAPEQMLDVAGNIQSRGTRTYLRGWDGATNHWIMAGGVTEGTNNALGFNVGTRTISPGPGWTLQGATIRAWQGVLTGNWGGDWWIPLGFQPIAAMCGLRQSGRSGSWCHPVCQHQIFPGWAHFWVSFPYDGGCCMGFCGTPYWEYDALVIGN